MMHQDDMRDLLNRVMVVDEEYHLEDIYDLVERHGRLDNEDLTPSSPKKTQPRWQETVRTTLSLAKKAGHAFNPRHGIHIRLRQFQ